MGQAAPLVKMLNCPCLTACATHVCNAMHFRSQCCSCCELSLDTDEIPVGSDSEEELEIPGCFHWVKR